MFKTIILSILLLSFTLTKTNDSSTTSTVGSFEDAGSNEGAIDTKKYSSVQVFNLSSKDPFFGVQMDNGYLDFPPSKEYKKKSNYYLYIKNSKNLPPNQIPLIITNPGGPCWSSQIELFIGVGPYKMDLKKLKLKKSKYTSEPFADTLFLEQPMGAGFSESDPYITSLERNSQDWLTSIDMYAKKFPDRQNKKRPIYLYISSYAGLDLTYALNDMMDLGYNVKGFVDDGPVGNMGKVVLDYMDNLYEYGDISWIRYQYFKWMSHVGNMMYNLKIFGNRGIGVQSQILPVIGLDGRLIASVNDVRPKHPYYHIKMVKKAVALTKSKNFQKAFNGRKPMQLINFDCQRTVAFNTHIEAETAWQKLLDRGVKAILLSGKYDFPYGIKTVDSWLKTQNFSKQGFNDVKWQKSEFGKKRSWKNQWLEVIDDSGHTIAVDRPEVIYKRMKQLVEGDILNE